MPATKAKSIKPNFPIAVQGQQQPILAFNSQGCLDVFLFDDTDYFMQDLNLSAEQRIPLSVLNNANILHTIASQTGLEIGKNKEDDEQILAYLKHKLSQSIENPDTAIKEICDSWNTVARHKISQPYMGLKSVEEAGILEYQACYPMVINDYIISLLHIISEKPNMPNWLILQACELVFSAFHAKQFSTNSFTQIDNLIAFAENCIKDKNDERSKKLLDKIKKIFLANKGDWYRDLIGAVTLEIESIIDDHGIKKAEELRKILLNILAGNYENEDTDQEIASELEILIPLLKEPLTSELYETYLTKDGQKPTAKQIRDAITDYIQKTAKEKNFALEEETPAATPFELAGFGKDQEQNKEKLISMLLDDNTLTKSVLKGIVQLSKDRNVREIALACMESAPLAFSSSLSSSSSSSSSSSPSSSSAYAWESSQSAYSSRKQPKVQYPLIVDNSTQCIAILTYFAWSNDKTINPLDRKKAVEHLYIDKFKDNEFPPLLLTLLDKSHPFTNEELERISISIDEYSEAETQAAFYRLDYKKKEEDPRYTEPQPPLVHAYAKDHVKSNGKRKAHDLENQESSKKSHFEFLTR